MLSAKRARAAARNCRALLCGSGTPENAGLENGPQISSASYFANHGARCAIPRHSILLLQPFVDNTEFSGIIGLVNPIITRVLVVHEILHERRRGESLKGAGYGNFNDGAGFDRSSAAGP